MGSPESERHGEGLPAGWYVAAGWDEEYLRSPVGGVPTREVHTGLDLNKEGGDYGETLYAVADGVVVSARTEPGTWGVVVDIHHPAIGLWSQSAHLSRLVVGNGEAVRQGQVIGAVGDAGGRFSSHLHFELRKTNLPAGYWPSGGGRSLAEAHRIVRQNYLDPLGRLGV